MSYLVWLCIVLSTGTCEPVRAFDNGTDCVEFAIKSQVVDGCIIVPVVK